MRQAITLRCQHLTHAYGQGETRTVAVRDVAFELRRGQVVLLMGPSGSGKSTLLSILSGLLRPQRGCVTVLGQELWRLSERQREAFRRRHFGFVFQGYHLFPALTAQEQLEIVLRWGEGAPARTARERAESLLTLLGLARQARLRPAQLAGGEKQRVAIGRALIKEPALCFADEPTSALDWDQGAQVVQLLRSAAHERGATVLMVAHDSRLMPYADRVLHIEDGRLAEAGAPDNDGGWPMAYPALAAS
jgi:putative ABC transport system ATP-binding protein